MMCHLIGHRFAWGLLALILSASAALAADGESAPAGGKRLSWDEALRTALTNHPAIKQAQHEALAQQAITKQVESANYPQVTGVYSSSGGNTRVLANLNVSGSLPKPTNYLTSPGLRADYLITDFGSTAHKILSNKALTAAAEKAVQTERALVILDVQQAYLNSLKRQRLVTIARETLKARQRILAQAEALYRQQLRSKLDLDFATVEMKRAELRLIAAQNNLTVAFAALSNALGLRSLEEFVLEEPPITITPSEPIEPLFEQSLANRPELLGSQDRRQAAEEALKSARALHYGNVTAIGTLSYTFSSRVDKENKGGPKNPGAQLGWWGAGVASSTPLYTGGRISGQVDEAEARSGEVRADTRSIANDIVLQVAKAYFGRLTAAQQVTVAEQQVSLAREALALSQGRYRSGLGSILEVITATADLLAAQDGLADAQYEYRASEAALAYATGREYTRYQP